MVSPGLSGDDEELVVVEGKRDMCRGLLWRPIMPMAAMDGWRVSMPPCVELVIRLELCGTSGFSFGVSFFVWRLDSTQRFQWAMEWKLVLAVNAPVVGADMVPKATFGDIGLCKLMSLA